MPPASQIKQSAQSPVPNIERAEQVNRAFSLDTIDASLAKADVSPSIISNCVETPAGWLEQAQHAAKDANSPEELSSIVEFCERGLRGTPDEKQSSSLRRLSAWAHNRRGELLADADRADDALSDFQAAISLDSDLLAGDPQPSRDVRPTKPVRRRASRFQSGHRAESRAWPSPIETGPSCSPHSAARKKPSAITTRLSRALPNDAQLYRDRAYAYQQLGEFSKSAADFDRALEIAPDDPDALTQRGNLAAEQGNYEQALADFQQALAKDPNWAEAHRSLAWLEATCPNPNFQNPQEAIAAAERAAKLAPANDYLILDTLAAAHASAGHFDKASELQQQALAVRSAGSAPSLKQRLALYRTWPGVPKRLAAPGAQTATNPTKQTAEANLPVGALR